MSQPIHYNVIFIPRNGESEREKRESKEKKKKIREGELEKALSAWKKNRKRPNLISLFSSLYSGFNVFFPSPFLGHQSSKSLSSSFASLSSFPLSCFSFFFSFLSFFFSFSYFFLFFSFFFPISTQSFFLPSAS